MAAAGAGAPTGDDIGRLARWIESAEFPLVICQRGDPAGRLSRALSEAAERLGLAVSEPFVVRNVLPGDHPALVGYGPPPMERADLVIVLDSGVPWIERATPPARGARVVHVGPDPLIGRMPVRGFRSDLTIAADPALVLRELAATATVSAEKARQVQRIADDMRARVPAVEPPEAGTVATPAWLSGCLSEIMDDDAVVFSELGLLPGAMRLKGPNRFFGNPHSGGLGWGLPAALGAQLADRERLVIAAIGDGSYMFANPVVCHQIAEALALPVLIVVKNNGGWNAVRRAVRGAYPDGSAMKRNVAPLTSLAPLPDFAAVARASRAHAERIEHGTDIPQALARAVEVIRSERRHVLLDVAVAATDTF